MNHVASRIELLVVIRRLWAEKFTPLRPKVRFDPLKPPGKPDIGLEMISDCLSLVRIDPVGQRGRALFNKCKCVPM